MRLIQPLASCVLVLSATATLPSMIDATSHFDVHAQVGDGPTGSFTEADLDDSLIRNAVGNLFRLIEGAFGALIMVVAGILAIVAAAMGNYRAAIGMLVVALGAFILRALVSLFFGTEFDAFQG